MNFRVPLHKAVSTKCWVNLSFSSLNFFNVQYIVSAHATSKSGNHRPSATVATSGGVLDRAHGWVPPKSSYEGISNGTLCVSCHAQQSISNSIFSTSLFGLLGDVWTLSIVCYVTRRNIVFDWCTHGKTYGQVLRSRYNYGMLWPDFATHSYLNPKLTLKLKLESKFKSFLSSYFATQT